MSTFWNRTLAITSITAAAALGLTGCGTDTSAAPSTSTEQTTEAPAASDSGQLTVDNFAERISAAQLAAGSVHNESTVVMGEQKTTMSGDVALSDDPAQVKMSLTMSAPTKMELRLVDSMLYMNMGEMSQNKFLATDLTSPEAAPYASMITQSNPQEQMAIFASAVKDFQVSDETTEIDGVETYEYTLTLDTATLLEGQGTATEGLELPETMSYVMNIGTDDLPRRMVSELNGVSTEMNYSKWGEAVTVEAPTADEIAEG